MVAEAAPVARHWTYSDIQALDGQRRIELYDGEIVEMPSPTEKHQELLARLFLILRLWAQQHRLGKVYMSPLDLYVSETKCYIPDLMFVRRERYASEQILREDGRCVIAPPDLVVEVLSESTARNDRGRKAQTYADLGVLNYWIIDPEVESVQAFTLENGRYAVESAVAGNDIFRPALFAGLEIPLAELFAPD